ncbi:MAG: hypothetical protein KJ069_03980 [Anaerolineae bacterium]|nr:hypothetical protein [Anaerolineae bacterium]
MSMVAISPARTDDAGYALTFNGLTHHVNLGDTGNIMPGDGWTSAMSISVWLRPQGTTSPATHPSSGQLIVGNDRPRLFGISRATYNGQDRIWVWNADSNGVDMIGIEFTPDEWLQVSLVHVNDTLYAYKNGELVGSVASGNTMLPGGTSDGILYIGGNGRTTTTPYFNGDIDEVRLWNVGLDQSTIQAWTYQVVTSAHPDWLNLMAYYQMSDGAGVMLTDNSANNNTGTLAGGMGDTNWVTSGAFLLPGTPTPTAVTPTFTPTQTPSVPTSTPTETPVQPTSTPTNTPLMTTTPSPEPTNTTPSPTPLPGLDYALAFDGNNDYVRLAETSQIMAPGWQDTKTVSLWVKPLGNAHCTFQSPAHCDAIFGDRARWWGISRGTISGNDRLWLWNYDGSYDLVGIEYTVGEWVHIAMVHGNGQLLAYKNGILVGSTPSGTTLQPNTGAQPVLHLGGIINTVDRNWTFAGYLDEVQIWDAARSQAEIIQDMSQPLSGSEAGLAAYYQMSDGSGLSLSDNSGHGWTGTLFDGGQGVPPDGSPPEWVSPGVFGGEPAPTATPTNTPTPTATPEGTAVPTNTPAPTNTSTPPPPTPTPTNTATPPPPTATPTSTSVGPTPTPGSGDSSALQFDGIANYMRLGTTSDVMGSGDWNNEKTVSVWVKPAPGNSPATQPSAGALLAGNDRPRNFGITRATYNGADRIWVWNADASGADFVGIDFTPGEWVHIALVHSGGTLYAYKNGQLVGSVASGATQSPGSMGTMYAAGTGRGQYLAGELDEIRIWDVALDAPTLQAWMYQEVSAGHPHWPNLLAYYQMNEGAGTAVTDSSPHDHNATLQGGMGNNNWVPGPW